MSLITTTAELESLVSRLKTAAFITVDTEFIREKTYWPRLCLIQVAGEGKDDAAAIDPLAPGIDLSSFYALMADERVLKVFHACRQDLEIFLKEAGALPRPVFDTQVAAMVCGYGEQAGYEALVNGVLKKTLDKTSRFTDWAQRPLTPKQISYALGDVTYLRPIYEKLTARLQNMNRMSWIEDEMRDLLDESNYVTKPEEAWLRLRLPSHKPRVLGILREIAAWRERAAQKVNIPRGRMLKDEALAEIATHPPATREALARMRNVHQGFAESEKGRELLDVVKQATEMPEADLPQRPERVQMPPGLGPTTDLLRVLLKLKCEENDVAPKLLCSAAELETLAAYGDKADVPALRGWRLDLFGREALALRAGQMALAVQDGRLKLIPA